MIEKIEIRVKKDGRCFPVGERRQDHNGPPRQRGTANCIASLLWSYCQSCKRCCGKKRRVMTPQNDIEVLKLKLDAVAETVIQLASHITAKDNVVTCPFCQERILEHQVARFAWKNKPLASNTLRNSKWEETKGQRDRLTIWQTGNTKWTSSPSGTMRTQRLRKRGN